MNFKKFRKISISFLAIIFLFSILYFSPIGKAAVVCDDPYSPYYDPVQCSSQYAPYLPPGMTEQEISTGQKLTNFDVSCSQYKYPWCQQAAQNPAGLVSELYKIALGLAAAAAMGVLIYGAILWTVSGAVSTKKDAMDWIWGAIWGLVLLLAAYLILYTINPNLVSLQSAEDLFKPVDTSNLNQATGGIQTNPTTNPAFKSTNSFDVANSNVSLDTSFVRTMFLSAGIGVKPECLYGNTANCESFQGLKGGIYNEMMDLRKDSQIYFTITGGTEAGHSPGEESHANGYKVDIRANNDQKDD